MKTKGLGIALLSTAALLGSAVAQAELPWTYAEFGYSKADGNDFFETDAYDLKASVGFLEKWHASLQYTDGETEGDFFSGDDFDGVFNPGDRRELIFKYDRDPKAFFKALAAVCVETRPTGKTIPTGSCPIISIKGSRPTWSLA